MRDHWYSKRAFFLLFLSFQFKSFKNNLEEKNEEFTPEHRYRRFDIPALSLSFPFSLN